MTNYIQRIRSLLRDSLIAGKEFGISLIILSALFQISRFDIFGLGSSGLFVGALLFVPLFILFFIITLAILLAGIVIMCSVLAFIQKPSNILSSFLGFIVGALLMFSLERYYFIPLFYGTLRLFSYSGVDLGDIATVLVTSILNIIILSLIGWKVNKTTIAANDR
jgi:hypothetical protein